MTETLPTETHATDGSGVEHRTKEPQPAAGPPWDVPFREAAFALIDLEMTGLDPTVDRVIEICIRRERGGVVEDRIETLVQPGPDTRFHTHVHGIDASMLREAPSFCAIADRVLALCEGAVLVAHGAAYDVAFLNSEFARAGRSTSFSFHLDTLVLARRVVCAKNHSLGALAKQLGIQHSTPHRAGSDVQVLCELFARLVADLKPANARDLWHVRVQDRQVRPEVLATCVKLATQGETAEIAYRPSHKPPRKMLAVVREVRTDLDPPLVMGYALPERGRFELRADRILWAAARPSPKPNGKAP